MYNNLPPKALKTQNMTPRAISMPNKNHPLFQTHALRGTAHISRGEVSRPYHIYDGYGAFIGGTADLTKVQQLLARRGAARTK
jgi:hypothetical protein